MLATSCVYRKLDSAILVVKAAEDRLWRDCAGALNGVMNWSVLVQRTMNPRPIVVGGTCAQDPAQVRFAKHDDVVETFAADRADESLNVSILPGRSGCDRVVPNAHCSDPLQEDRTIRGVCAEN